MPHLRQTSPRSLRGHARTAARAPQRRIRTFRERPSAVRRPCGTAQPADRPPAARAHNAHLAPHAGTSGSRGGGSARGRRPVRAPRARRSAQHDLISSWANFAPMQRRTPPPNRIHVYVAGARLRKRSGRKAWGRVGVGAPVHEQMHGVTTVPRAAGAPISAARVSRRATTAITARRPRSRAAPPPRRRRRPDPLEPARRAREALEGPRNESASSRGPRRAAS